MSCKTSTIDNNITLGRVWVYKLPCAGKVGRGGKSKFRMSYINPACGTQCTQTLGFITHKDAFRIRHEKLLEISHKLKNNDFLSWQEWVDYDLNFTDGSVSNNYHDLLAHCLSLFGYILPTNRLSEIALRDVLNYRSERARDGIAHSTINTEMRVVLGSLHRAVDHGFLLQSPIDSMRARGRYNMLFLKEYKSSIKIPSPGEFGRMLAVSPHLSFDALFNLAWWAGLRCGECLALRWNEIDFKKKCITVEVRKDFKPKSGLSRKIPLADQLIKFLKFYKRRIKPSAHDYVVTSTSLRTDKLVRVRGVAANIATLVRRAGLLDAHNKAAFSLHHLRKACITRWFDEGVTIDDVQRWAGHSKLEITIKYYKAANEI